MITFEPKTAVIPGRILVNLLSKENISQKELALKTGLTEKHISNMVQGKASISDDTAIKLEYVFGGKASFWINLQKSYDEIAARQAFEQQLNEEVLLLKKFPFKKLADCNLVQRVTKPLDKVKELLKFFGVPSLKQIKYAQAVAYHQTAVKDRRVDQNSVAAWLRIGDIKFKEISEEKDVPEYVEGKFKNSMSDIRALTRSKDFFEKLPKVLLEKGVVLIYSPYLPKTYISGAVRWIGGRPVIQISDHLKSTDGLFFTIFHEFAHILLHDKREDYLDYEGLSGHDAAEKEANEWACEMLIKQVDYDVFVKQNRITATAIEKFADDIKVNKDIVVGRLAHDGKISWRDRARLVGKVSYSAKK